MTLGNDPMQETPLRLKRLRPLALLLTCEKSDGSRLDLTGASLRLTLSEQRRKGGALLHTAAGVFESAADGTVRFDVQGADLDMAVGVYDLVITLTTAELFEVSIVEGEVELIHNPDTTAPVVAGEVVPPLSLTARFRNQNKVTVRTNHVPDSVLLDYTGQAATSASVAGAAADAAEVSAAAAWNSAAAAHASIEAAGAEGERRAGIEADRAAMEADAAAASAEQAAAPTAEQLAVVDANPASTFRQQQDSRLSATIAAAADPISGNRFICAGDSISSFDFSNNISPWAKVAEGYVNGRLNVVRSAGVSGDTSALLLARLQADVIDHSPAIVSVLIGTNDSPAVPDATYKANVTAIHDTLRDAGIRSIVCTIPPRNDSAPANATIGRWNAWLKNYALTTDRPLFDFHAAVVDRATGGLRADCSLDGVHLTSVGHAALAEVVADAVAALLPPFSPLVPETNVDTGCLVSNPLLLTGSPWPTGFTPAGSATGTTEAIITDDPDFKGNAWEWVMDGADVGFRQLQTQLTWGSGLVGHRLLFMARVKVLSQTGLDQGEGVGLPVIFDGATSGAVQYMTQGFAAPGRAALFRQETVVPAGTTAVYFQPSIQNDATGEPITARVGEIAVYDLTALGLA